MGGETAATGRAVPGETAGPTVGGETGPIGRGILGETMEGEVRTRDGAFAGHPAGYPAGVEALQTGQPVGGGVRPAVPGG